MELTEIFAIAVTAALSAAAIKKYAPETSMVIGISAGVLILLKLFSRVTPIINELNGLMIRSGIDSSYGTILIKSIGICLVCQFTGDVCRDAGNTSLAGKVELASRLTVILISLPLYEQILIIVSGLLNG